MNNARGMFFKETNIGNLDLQLTDSSNVSYLHAKNSGNIRNTNIKVDASSKLRITKR